MSVGPHSNPNRRVLSSLFFTRKLKFWKINLLIMCHAASKYGIGTYV